MEADGTLGPVTSESSDPLPTLMKRRWWVTITVALAGLVVLVWWIRQPDTEPMTEEPDAAETQGSTEAALTLPDAFAVGDRSWQIDDSPEAQERLESALGQGFEGRTTAEDGTPGGALYFSGGDAATEPLATSIVVNPDFVTAPIDTAYGVLEGNGAAGVAGQEIDDSAIACGYLPLEIADGTTYPQWACAIARDTTVINLLWPLSIANGEDAAEQTAAFFEAARG